MSCCDIVIFFNDAKQPFIFIILVFVVTLCIIDKETPGNCFTIISIVTGFCCKIIKNQYNNNIKF